jgi:nitroimidazol reductase NimA-like FMN-containing flavoprotein (pyridoxamine 5'-phosphate oxidase superfamily)
MSIENIQRLLRECRRCVLATTAGGTPPCSLMTYVVDADCRTIYMVTARDTRKYGNLRQNPQVSLLVDNRDAVPGAAASEIMALTVAGTCECPRDPQVREAAAALLRRSGPELEKLLDEPGAAIIAIKICSFQLLKGIKDAFSLSLEA